MHVSLVFSAYYVSCLCITHLSMFYRRQSDRDGVGAAAEARPHLARRQGGQGEDAQAGNEG